MHELPLVFFTLLGQMAAGIIFLSTLSSRLNYRNNPITLKKLTLSALIIMMLAMIIASLHLGHPLRAFNVIFGIGRSPMSNEIFTFGLLFGSTLFTLMLILVEQYPNWPCPRISTKCRFILDKFANLPKLVAIIQLILSLAFVWTIVLTYKLATVQTWDNPYTIIFMFTAMLTLGGTWVTLFGLTQLGMVGFFIGSMVTLALIAPYYRLMASIAPDLITGQSIWLYAKVALIILSFAFSMLWLVFRRKSLILPVISFVLVFFGELSGRIAFYNLWQISM